MIAVSHFDMIQYQKFLLSFDQFVKALNIIFIHHLLINQIYSIEPERKL